MALYVGEPTPETERIDAHILSRGFEPHDVVLNEGGLTALIGDIDKLGLWDQRCPHNERGRVLLATPWGFRWLTAPTDFDEVLGKPLLDFEVA